MRNRLTVGLGIVVAVLMVAVAAQTNVAGKWNVTFDTEQGSSAATMTLTQDGEKLGRSSPKWVPSSSRGPSLATC